MLEINELVKFLEIQLSNLTQEIQDNINDRTKFYFLNGKKSQIEETLYKIDKICNV